MSPESIGIHSLDSLKSHILVKNVIEFAIKNSKPSQIVVCKVLEGENTNSKFTFAFIIFLDLINSAKDHFNSIRQFRPQATRKRSSESYLILKF